jgi:outer membrane receptor protein involved in Fe transport
MRQSATIGLVLLVGAAGAALAQTAPGPQAGGPQAGATLDQAQSVPDVNVVGSTPLLGSGIDRNTVPAATTVLGSQQIDRTLAPSLTDAILGEIPGAFLNENDGNPFQPDISYRGFVASPVSGEPQGLAVYVNGARFNEPFGDTVNWDLIPPAAIDSVNVEAANPVFGLNALGGSVNVQLKNGFTFHGADFTGYGGSYARGAGILEYGRQVGNFAVYAAGEVQHDDGWRITEQSDLYQLYTDLGWRNDAAELHLGITAASTALGNPGAAPTQALDFDRRAIFTAPNTVFNKYLNLNLNGSYALSDTTTLQVLVYYQNLTQRLINGDTGEVDACDDNENYLCYEDGVPVTNRSGQRVAPFLPDGAFYSSLALDGTNSQGFGGSGQITNDNEIFGHANHLVGGASFDGGDVRFHAQQLLGGLNDQRFFTGPGVTQDAPDEGIVPTDLATVTRYYGVFASDVFTLLPKLSLTVSGRFNNAEVDLHDKFGTALSGQHTYNRFNPGGGLTYELAPYLTAYGSYSESNRAPTPNELACADPDQPCALPNGFISDPDLKQVVAKTFELGLRGKIADLAGGTLTWNADYYHTENTNDIIFVVSQSTGLGYFTNAGDTLRQGVEANLRWQTGRLRASLGYAYTDATYQSPLLLESDLNPGADADGIEHIVKGDRIPGVPAHRGTLVIDYAVNDRLTVGTSTIAQSGQYLFGDEANTQAKLGGFVTTNFNASYKVTDNVTVFALLNNAFDAKYYTFGTFGPVGDAPWNDIPGGVTNPRDAVPAAPISVYGGVRVKF